MSVPQPSDGPSGGDGETVPVDDIGITTPTLQHPSRDLSVQPLVASLVRGQFNWEKASFTTLGGETITQDGPPQPARVTVEGIITQSGLDDLIALMQQTRRVEFISEPLTQTIAFDTFQFDQTEELNAITIERPDGTPVREAAYEFQIQHKEETDDTGGLFG